jgi:niacin transporter
MYRFTMTKTKRLIFAGLCVALGVVLPVAFHSVANAGSIFLPMHIPVFLCCLVCGWPFGLACGVLARCFRAVHRMPPMAYLPSMALRASRLYGMPPAGSCGFVKTGKLLVDLLSFAHRGDAGGPPRVWLLNAVIFRAGSYSLPIWMNRRFVTCACPGIIISSP